MEQLDQIVTLLALTMGVGWASGINLYATLATLGILSMTGNMVLPEELNVLSNPMVIAAAGLMYMVEFTADKIPGVDSIWDSIHTFIRIPAGAVLAAGMVGDAGAGMELAAAIVGGGLATTTHVTKTGSRMLINTSPEPMTNWIASITEDVVVILGIWTAVQSPWLFLLLLVLFILLLLWLLPKIWRGLKKAGRGIKSLFIKQKEEATTDTATKSPIDLPRLDR
jgi:Domain of unknown function (DUF4126)